MTTHLKIFKFRLVSLALLSLILLSGCSNKVPESPETTIPQLEFTVEALSTFDGMDGRLAYIAIDNSVYDVTEVSFWKSGIHNGFPAGKDYSAEIENISPHGISKLKGIPIVGKLIN